METSLLAQFRDLILADLQKLSHLDYRERQHIKDHNLLAVISDLESRVTKMRRLMWSIPVLSVILVFLLAVSASTLDESILRSVIGITAAVFYMSFAFNWLYRRMQLLSVFERSRYILTMIEKTEPEVPLNTHVSA